MRKTPLLLLLLLGLLAFHASAQPINLQRSAVHISTATTTTLVAAVTGGPIEVWTLSVCVQTGGTTTTITLVDGAGTNLIGTSVTYVLAPGTCFVAPYRGFRYFAATAVSQALRLVTNDVGPVDVVVEVVK